MIRATDRNEALGVVLDAIGAETGCSHQELLGPGVRIVERPCFEPRPAGARRYPVGDPGITAFSFGVGSVVAASASLIDEVRRIVTRLHRDAPFAPATTHQLDELLKPHGLRAPAVLPRLLAWREHIREIDPPADVTVHVEEHPSEDRLESLVPERWPNAIRLGREARPTTALAVARRAGEVVAVASTNAETERLSQTGVEVAPAHQGMGLAALVVSAVARRELECGRVPYYGFDPANIRSQRTALAVGYVPTWVELVNVTADRVRER